MDTNRTESNVCFTEVYILKTDANVGTEKATKESHVR